MSEDFPVYDVDDLGPVKAAFKNQLERYPHLMFFWDADKKDFDTDGIRNALPAMSNGEAIMAQFFCGVWTGTNDLGFDFFKAAKQLGDRDLAVIQKWLYKPEFP